MTTGDDSVRPAGPDDLDRCRQLLEEARQESRAVRGGDLLAALGSAGTPPAADWWLAPDRALLVGEFHGAVVGVATGQVVGRLGRVDCCYVEPGARQVGVGADLVRALLGWFADRGCSDVDALALPGDRSTKQLLEASGFKARLLVLHRRLP
ncbi:MAG TPA: GNAT family N-acetyltransferase [Acidimicrobiales bacterium]|nr:GNAT family N-acetyltransferase [Acidimicrobiales bacterium]